MTHLRKAIRQAFADALGAVSGVTVFVNRARPVRPSQLPAFEVRTPTEQSESADKNGQSDRRLTITVAIMTDLDTGADQTDIFAREIEPIIYQSSAIEALVVDLELASTTLADSDDGEALFWTLVQTWTGRYIAPETDPTTS